jgi:hypothetical protein
LLEKDGSRSGVFIDGALPILRNRRLASIEPHTIFAGGAITARRDDTCLAAVGFMERQLCPFEVTINIVLGPLDKGGDDRNPSVRTLPY